MIATTNHSSRAHKTRQKLSQLRQMGYEFITTTDDGDTWIPTREPGLEIKDLIESSFMGEILIEDK